MEGSLETSPFEGYCVDDDDLKYISGVSTILVATIQEVKDRVSQIEYIFCSQLFPNFQSRSKNLLKMVAEARKAAEDGCRKKESSLLLQIEELRLEKVQALEQNRVLVATLEQEKANCTNIDKFRDVEDEWRKKERCLLLQVKELQLERQKVYEENQFLVASLKQEKAKLLNNERVSNEHEAENKLLLVKVEHLEKSEEVVDLQSQLKLKNLELYEKRKSIKDLYDEIELKRHELVVEKKKRRDVTEGYKRLKSQYNFLLSKSGLKLENNLHNNKVEEESKSPRLPQNPSTTNGSGNRAPDASRLESRTNEQKGETSLSPKVEENQDMPTHNPKSNSISKSTTSTSSSSRPLISPASVKSEKVSGMKRSASSWRETRSRQEPGGADPHDDFLDTPLENIKDNLNRDAKEEIHDLPVPPPNDMNFDSSDDETQDLNAQTAPKKQKISINKFDDRGFKYVEPVRRKADRENLKGVECKQCKKFYDAVLPNGGQNGGNNNSSFRCEHHDGVSRHRYRYVPPSTPEGFWNIGFESEM